MIELNESDCSFIPIPNHRHRQIILDKVAECDYRRRRRHKDEMSERSKVKARINLWRDENKRYLRYGQSGLDTSIMDETATHARQDEGTEWTYSDHDDDDDSDGVMAMAERKREIPG